MKEVRKIIEQNHKTTSEDQHDPKWSGFLYIHILLGKKSLVVSGVVYNMQGKLWS